MHRMFRLPLRLSITYRKNDYWKMRFTLRFQDVRCCELKKMNKKTAALAYLWPFNVVRAVAAAAAAAAAAAILFALPSTFCVCVGDSLAANALSVCNISTGFRDAGQSGRMDAASRCRVQQRRAYERADRPTGCTRGRTWTETDTCSAGGELGERPGSRERTNDLQWRTASSDRGYVSGVLRRKENTIPRCNIHNA